MLAVRLRARCFPVERFVLLTPLGVYANGAYTVSICTLERSTHEIRVL